MHDLVVFHAAATWAMVGLIWMVQMVQYPQFHHVGQEKFCAYHASHMMRITIALCPLLLVEMGTAAWLLWNGERHGWFLASLPFMAVNVGSTFLLQAPLHGRLSTQYSEALIRRLIATNWLRTVAWTTRGVCVLMWLRVVRE
ncbi:MAG: hypothetical protein JWO89_1532 [Verrucomicrobiaceae bacterium]|nr:hypothetical protein [Verrucomicrobiaceae bacterium]